MKKLIVFYDNACPLCEGVKKLALRLDWFHRLRFVGIRNNNTLPFSLTKMSKEMYAYDIKRKSYFKGVSAVYKLTSQVPMLWILAGIIKLSMLLGLGNKVYALIANNRFLIPVGHCNDNCRI